MEWIEQQPDLDAWLPVLRDTTIRFLDSEFMRGRHFHPQPCVLQYLLGSTVTAIDLVAGLDCQALGATFEQPEALHVLHACSEDLEVFIRLGFPVPVTLFDTQIAAALCGVGSTMGLSALSEQLGGPALDKTVSRTDWSRRPLDRRQLDYAADDVRCLEPIYRQLSERLREQGRETWMQEEMQTLRVRALEAESVAAESALHRQRGLDRLSVTEGIQYLALLEWREKWIRTADIPRKRWCEDDTLLTLVQKQPRSLTHLSRLCALPGRFVQPAGKEALERLDAVRSLAPESPRLQSSRKQVEFARARLSLNRSSREQAREIVNRLATELKLDSSFFAPRLMVDAIALYFEKRLPLSLPEVLGEWRMEQLKADLEN